MDPISLFVSLAAAMQVPISYCEPRAKSVYCHFICSVDVCLDTELWKTLWCWKTICTVAVEAIQSITQRQGNYWKVSSSLRLYQGCAKVRLGRQISVMRVVKSTVCIVGTCLVPKVVKRPGSYSCLLLVIIQWITMTLYFYKRSWRKRTGNR